MFFLLPALASVASAGAGLAGAAATTAAAATSGGVGTLAAAAGAGYALGSACGGGSRRPREQQSAGVSREELRRELEAAYTKGYEEARRAVMDELKAIEYERGRRSARSK